MSKNLAGVLKAAPHEALIQEIKTRMDHSDLSSIDSCTLKKELEKRFFYVFEDDPTDEDIDLDDVELADIVKYVEAEGYMVIEEKKIVDYVSELPSYKLKDFLCDLVGVNHHTEKNEVLKLLGEKF